MFTEKGAPPVTLDVAGSTETTVEAAETLKTNNGRSIMHNKIVISTCFSDVAIPLPF
jgi:hypothetical protein